jgi:hypothetical protein
LLKSKTGLGLLKLSYLTYTSMDVVPPHSQSSMSTQSFTPSKTIPSVEQVAPFLAVALRELPSVSSTVGLSSEHPMKSHSWVESTQTESEVAPLVKLVLPEGQLVQAKEPGLEV